MRELRPLQLPSLVATRKDLTLSSDDVTIKRPWASDASLSPSEASSPPLSPSLSSRSHSRFPSSTSSLASATSPNSEHADISLLAAKVPMPQLTEEPSESEDAGRCSFTSTDSPRVRSNVEGFERFSDPIKQYSFLDDRLMPAPVHNTSSPRAAYSPPVDAFSDWRFDDDFDTTMGHLHRRDISVDSCCSVRMNVVHRSPSSSSKPRHRKQDSKFTDCGLNIYPFSLPTSTRTSSLTNSLFQTQDHCDRSSVSGLQQSDISDVSLPVSPVDVCLADDYEPFDRVNLASTPLLPPAINEITASNHKLRSPLQSPKIADNSSVFSEPRSPAGTPQTRHAASPSLSLQTSLSSFQPPRFGGNTFTAEPAPFVIPDPNDKWSRELGHANFYITPEPYLPDHCDMAAYTQLLASWEEAKLNYLRHLHRTLEHYGMNSRAFKLTEEKWSEINHQWESFCYIAYGRAVSYGSDDKNTSAFLRTPMDFTLRTAMLPAVQDQDKFPKLGDEAIVGPMEQIAARHTGMQHTPSSPTKHRGGLLKLLLPGSMFRRSKR